MEVSYDQKFSIWVSKELSERDVYPFVVSHPSQFDVRLQFQMKNEESGSLFSSMSCSIATWAEELNEVCFNLLLLLTMRIVFALLGQAS